MVSNMTNLEKIAKVFEELGCDVDYDLSDNEHIEVRYEMITNRTDHEFVAYFDKNVFNEIDLDDLNWEMELKTRFNFEEELDYIEEDFCRYYMEDLRVGNCFYAANLENIAHNWYDEIEDIKADFEEFCTNFERLIEKYIEEE